jgi:hypothetical protein
MIYAEAATGLLCHGTRAQSAVGDLLAPRMEAEGGAEIID